MSALAGRKNSSRSKYIASSIGKRKTTAEWPRGTYDAEFEIRRDGATAVARRFSFDLR